MRNQIWENLHPISHLASEKWEVGPKREFSSLKVYPQDSGGGNLAKKDTKMGYVEIMLMMDSMQVLVRVGRLKPVFVSSPWYNLASQSESGTQI